MGINNLLVGKGLIIPNPNFAQVYASLFGPTGSTSRVNTPNSSLLNIGASSDFTIEFWFYLTGTSSFRCAGSFVNMSTAILRIDSAWTTSVGVSIPFTTLATPSLNKWYHYAICRASGTAYVFVNGVQYVSQTGNAYSVNLQNVVLGNYASNVNQEWLGYISEFRVSNVARYALGSTFIPYVIYSPRTNDLNVLLYTFNSASYVDTSPQNLGALAVTNGTNAPTLSLQTITRQ